MTISGSGNNVTNKSKSILAGELAEKITQGDRSASNEFVKINYQWLLFVIRKKFSQSNNHEDIVQDSFMLVINKLQQGKIRKTQAVLGFLRTTAINIGFEYLRKDKKFKSSIDSELINLIEDVRDNVDVLTNLEWLDGIKKTRKIIDELKMQRDKDILLKFYFEDIDKASVCKQLNLSNEHFDRVLYRAKHRLKLLFYKESYDNGYLKGVKR